MIPRLPYWILTEKKPAFYETESRTAVEMVAKVYSKIQELVDDYNLFIDEINKHLEEYEVSINQDFNSFKSNIDKIVHDYIATLDMKVNHMDRQLQEATNSMTANLKQTVEQVVDEMKEAGEFDEAIVNAFDSLGGRVITLETTITSLTERIETIENTNMDIRYESETIYLTK